MIEGHALTLAAVRMLTEYRDRDGRRLHPDDTLSMIRGLIDLRHPDLDADAVDNGHEGDE